MFEPSIERRALIHSIDSAFDPSGPSTRAGTRLPPEKLFHERSVAPLSPQHPPSRDSSRNSKLLSGPDDFKWGLKGRSQPGPRSGKEGAPSAPAHSLDQEGQSSEQEWGAGRGSRPDLASTPPQAGTAPPATRSFWLSPAWLLGWSLTMCRAAGCSPQTSPVLFQVVELLRHRRAAAPPRWSCPTASCFVGPPPLPASSGVRMGRSLEWWARPPWRGMGRWFGRGAGL